MTVTCRRSRHAGASTVSAAIASPVAAEAAAHPTRWGVRAKAG